MDDGNSIVLCLAGLAEQGRSRRLFRPTAGGCWAVANSFQRKIVPAYSSWRGELPLAVIGLIQRVTRHGCRVENC